MESGKDELFFEISVSSSYEWEMDVRIALVSEDFRCAVEVETNPDWLNDLAANFRGYPKSRDDRFRIEVGIAKYQHALIEASCADLASHTVLTITLTEGSRTSSYRETLVVFPFEPAAADEFAAALEQIAETRTGRAQLAIAH